MSDLKTKSDFKIVDEKKNPQRKLRVKYILIYLGISTNTVYISVTRDPIPPRTAKIVNFNFFANLNFIKMPP